MRALSSRRYVVLLAGLAVAGAAEAQTRGSVASSAASAVGRSGGFVRPAFGPGRSPVMAGDVFSSAGPSAFQRRAFGYGRLLGRGVVAPAGFGAYGFGYGGFGGYGIGGYGLPLTGGIVDPFGIPLDAGAPPPPGLPLVTNPDHGPSLVGIAPSPVKPPAIYVIGGDRRSARVRSGTRDGGVRQAETDGPAGARIITLGPDRS